MPIKSNGSFSVNSDKNIEHLSLHNNLNVLEELAGEYLVLKFQMLNSY